jgi:hypothetical protein
MYRGQLYNVTLYKVLQNSLAILILYHKMTKRKNDKGLL